MSSEVTELFINHQVSGADLAVLAAIRLETDPYKGMVNGPEARENYDQITESVSAAEGVKYQNETIGGVSGVWCRLEHPLTGTAILYLHGGGYVVGSAHAYRHFAGQFADRTGADVFVADYGLAPEHRFPTALNHAKAVYAGLIDAGYRQIVVVGDSAGGGLALSLVAQLAANPDAGHGVSPVCCVAMSPWTDLALTGASFIERAEEEMYLTHAAVQSFAKQYLAGHDANPR